MSVEAITVVLHHSQAKGTAKLVMIGIANHDGDGGSWPAIATLARYASVDVRTVQRAISGLVDLGELLVHAQDGGTRDVPAHLRPNRYTILVACPPECDRTTRHRVTPAPPGDARATGRGDASATRGGDAGVTGGGDTAVTGGVTPASPKPSVEPSFKPSSPFAVADGNGPKTGKATRLPEDWVPSPRVIDQMRAEGISDDLARSQLLRFRDYWHAKPGKDATKIDWDGTWRNWLRRAADEHPTASRGNLSGTPRQQAESERFDRAMSRAMEREKAMGLR